MSKAPTDQLRKVGAALDAIAKALEELPDDASRMRVLRATAALLDLDPNWSPVPLPRRSRA